MFRSTTSRALSVLSALPLPPSSRPLTTLKGKTSSAHFKNPARLKVHDLLIKNKIDPGFLTPMPPAEEKCLHFILKTLSEINALTESNMQALFKYKHIKETANILHWLKEHTLLTPENVEFLLNYLWIKLIESILKIWQLEALPTKEFSTRFHFLKNHSNLIPEIQYLISVGLDWDTIKKLTQPHDTFPDIYFLLKLLTANSLQAGNSPNENITLMKKLLVITNKYDPEIIHNTAVSLRHFKKYGLPIDDIVSCLERVNSTTLTPAEEARDAYRMTQ